MKNSHISHRVTPFSLSHDTLPSLRQALFKSPNPATWSKITEQDLTNLATRCQAHWTQTSRVLNSSGFWVVLPGALALLATVLTAAALSTQLNSLGGAAFMLAAYGLYGMAFSAGVLVGYQICVQAFGWDAAEYISVQLKPLCEADHDCVKTVLLASQSQRALDYRDSVLQAGRILRQVDLRILRALANLDWFVAEKAEITLACRPAHDLEMA